MLSVHSVSAMVASNNKIIIAATAVLTQKNMFQKHPSMCRDRWKLVYTHLPDLHVQHACTNTRKKEKPPLRIEATPQNMQYYLLLRNARLLYKDGHTEYPAFPPALFFLLSLPLVVPPLNCRGTARHGRTHIRKEGQYVYSPIVLSELGTWIGCYQKSDRF